MFSLKNLARKGLISPQRISYLFPRISFRVAASNSIMHNTR